MVELKLYNKKKLLEICNEKGITNTKGKKKNELIELIEKSEMIKCLNSKHIINSSFNFIYHISDIHIKLLERHDEYKRVFDRLFQELNKLQEKNNNQGCIVITGDTIDHKTKLEPETILTGRYLFKNLSKIAPVIVILGNHDVAQTNSSRIDKIRPLIDDLDNIFLLDRSGVYETDNISFCVSGIYDEEQFIEPKFVETDKMKIALFHGIVQDKCKDYLKFNPDKHSIDFEGYDFVLLGDVHEHFFIKDTMAYAGSLIQQKFDEHLQNHGFIEWDLVERCGNYHKIYNDTALVEVFIKDCKCISEIPEFCAEKNLFIKYTIENSNDILDIKSKLNEKYKIIKEKYNYKVSNSIEKIDNKNNEIDNISINHEILIKEYLKGETEDIQKKIIKYHKDLVSKLHLFTNTGLNLWQPKQFEFKNILNYGLDKNNIISFQNKIIGIVAPNTYGKTNIMFSLIFSLFGSIPNVNNFHILNKNDIDDKLIRGKSIIEIKSSKDIYEIQRSIEMNGVDRVKIKTNLLKNNSPNDFETTVKTQKDSIETLIGTRDDFLITNVYSNTLHDTIITSKTESALYEILRKILKLNDYDKINSELKKEYKKMKTEVDTMNGNLEMLEETIQNINLEEIKKEGLELNTKLIPAKEKLEQQTEKYNKQKEKLNDVENKLENLYKSYDEDLENECLEDIVNELEEINKDKFDFDNYFTEKKIKKLTKEIQKYKLLLKENKKVIDEDYLKKYPCEEEFEDETYDKCIKLTIETYKEDISILKSKIKKVKTKTFDIISKDSILDLLSKNKIKKEECIEMLKNILEKNFDDKMIKYINFCKQEKIKEEIEEKEDLLQKVYVQENTYLVNKIKSIQDILDEYDLFNEINELKEKIENINLNNKLKDDVSKYKKQKSSIEEKLKNYNEIKIKTHKNICEIEFEIKTLENKIKDYTNNCDKFEKLYKSKQELLINLDCIDKYKIATDKREIPFFIMKKYLGIISDLVNEFIGDLVDFRFEIFNDESKIKMNIIKSNNERYPICSGFERFICNIGLKYAFRKISKNSCGKIFFLDEGMDCIDEDNFKNIGIILKKLQSLFDNIFVITHINDIKNYIDGEINIGKENNSSFIIN